MRRWDFDRRICLSTSILETEGWITREQRGGRGRQVVLALTEAGRLGFEKHVTALTAIVGHDLRRP